MTVAAFFADSMVSARNMSAIRLAALINIVVVIVAEIIAMTTWYVFYGAFGQSILITTALATIAVVLPLINVVIYMAKRQQVTKDELSATKGKLEDWDAELHERNEELHRNSALAAKAHAESISSSSDQSSSQFLALMSHELKTPLNAIIGFSEIIKNQRFGPVGSDRYLDYLGSINDSGKHLLGIVSDVLEMSKIESGATELEEEEINVVGLLNSVVEFVRNLDSTARISVGLDERDGPLPKLLADKKRLKQVLVNLVINAIKFTESNDRVILKAWCTTGAGYVFQVVDSGIGIPPEEVAKALAPFQQIDAGNTRKYEGAGLGLPLAKGLVALHGGSLDIQSELGEGTTVTVRLPARRVVKVAKQLHEQNTVLAAPTTRTAIAQSG